MTTLKCGWDPPPTELTLFTGEIHIWCAGLDHPAAYVQQLACLLGPDERLRAERYYFERDRRRFIVGRGVLRVILGRYLRLEPGQLHFGYGAYGKPSLADSLVGNENRLGFNLAHSQGLALYAVAREQEIGVDVEYIRPLAEADQIAQRFFSAGEVAMLRTLPPEQQPEAFFNCWTRKEAYIKATGAGLAQPLDQFDVSLVPGEPARLLSIAGDPQAATLWFMQNLTPAPGYAAAVALPAITRQDWRLKYWRFFDDRL